MMNRNGFLLLTLFFACSQPKKDIVVLPEEKVGIDLSAIGKEKLSDYGFFIGGMKALNPAEGVLPYTINSALFSDYALKKRFVKIPHGSKAVYNAQEVFEFPQGTVLIKNFYYPADFRKPDDRIRLLETRLLIKEANDWKTLPYIWNEEQTEAYLEISGKKIPVSWTDGNGEIRQVDYSVPNMNQCKSCHLKGEKVVPIGPSARQLNTSYEYVQGVENQLTRWNSLNVLEGLPTHDVPRLAAYENMNEAVEKRARAWLEINCAHCHRADGPAKNTGLYLLASESDLSKLGVGKAPVAAGKGSGGLMYDIVPGNPDQSILQFRIESTHPGIMMPEVGRIITHKEGVALVRKWIKEMR